MYTSCPKTHVVVFKERKGLVKLTLEVGAQLTPIYVFGGTDFFYNIVAGDNFIARLARKLRMGLALFYGPYFLPLPFTPRVTFCYGEPLPLVKWESDRGPIPNELIEDMHDKVNLHTGSTLNLPFVQYLRSLKAVFDKYKAAAGYPEAELTIL